ncbi:plasmid mobilization relaxosome protein MobC [Pedobacter fastidiosus]|uniref:plasmid mobilization relaxosome protein MobC n=1 Tax=Pedobacter fastidiosus TaxID=2765361 RepID=UPI00361D8A4C
MSCQPLNIPTHHVHVIMARPQKEKEEKRSTKFTFRMNEKEVEQLASLCAYSNLSGAEVLREIVFKNRLLQPKIPVLDLQSYGELKRIGNNINQIAKQLNSKTSNHIDYKVMNELSLKLDTIIKIILR